MLLAFLFTSRYSGVARHSFLGGGGANAEGARPFRGVHFKILKSRVPEMRFQAFWG